MADMYHINKRPEDDLSDDEDDTVNSDDLNSLSDEQAIFDAADDVVAKFQNMVNDYEETTDMKGSKMSDKKAHKSKMNAIFGNIQNFKKNKLKETETVVRHLVRIVDRPGGAGPDSALNEDEIKEFYDSEQELQEKALKFARLLKSSQYVVVHTGYLFVILYIQHIL